MNKSITLSLEEVRSNLELHLKKSQELSDFSDLIKYISNLPSIYSDKIEVKELLDQHSRCFDFAFDVQIAHKNAVRELLEISDLIRPINRDHKTSGDIVIYFVSSVPVHAGKVTSKDKILSKWNTGPVIEHEELIVPFDYGSTTTYFRIIDMKAAQSFLRNYQIN